MASTQTPEEKIKSLLDMQSKKQKELEEKKAEFERQKKELDLLEAKTKNEVAGTRKEIEEKIEEIAAEQREEFEALEKKRIGSLEDTVRQEEIPAQVREAVQANPNFYQVTNYNVIGSLDNLADAAGQRPLTRNEREFMETVRYHAERLQKDDFYKDKQGAQYLSQEIAKIDFINKMAKQRDYQ